MIFNVILKDLVKKFFCVLIHFSVYLLGSGSGSGSIWTFLGFWIRIRMKTYADPKHCTKLPVSHFLNKRNGELRRGPNKTVREDGKR